MAAAKHIELPAVTVPPHLWMRSGRPVQGRIVQVVVPGALILAALLASGSGATLRVGLVLVGAALFLSLPALVLGRLERLGREVQAANARSATTLLQSLPNRTVVRYFAPYAWRTLQDGILQLKIGDGKAAATNFAETARLVHQPEAVMLVSAQAHALVLAGERTAAYGFLQRLAKENLLGSRDQLDLGIVLLVESQKKNKQALAYIEAARKTIGDHPRVLAALALALQKTERIDEASELLEQVQISLQGGEADPVVEDLVKRARKGLQVFIESQLRRERRSRSRRTTIVVSSDLAASEIVSGEIGAGDLAELDNPTTAFRPADSGSPSVISSKSVDGELTSEERTMLNLPNSPTRRAEDARASAFSIEEDGPGEPEKTSVPPPEAPVASPRDPVTSGAPGAAKIALTKEPVGPGARAGTGMTPEPAAPTSRAAPRTAEPTAPSIRAMGPNLRAGPAKSPSPAASGAAPRSQASAKQDPLAGSPDSSGSIASSLLDSLFTEPTAPTTSGNISLIKPAVAVPSTAPDLGKSLSPPPSPEPVATRPSTAKSASEVDVPVFRRKPVNPAGDRSSQLGNLPTGGNSGLTGTPPGGAKTPELPTRTAQGKPPFGATSGGAPKSTTPMFRAPIPGKSNEGDPNDDSGRH